MHSPGYLVTQVVAIVILFYEMRKFMKIYKFIKHATDLLVFCFDTKVNTKHFKAKDFGGHHGIQLNDT
jgi:hypothetical protein